jgi:hypothetical protein
MARSRRRLPLTGATVPDARVELVPAIGRTALDTLVSDCAMTCLLTRLGSLAYSRCSKWE